MHIALSVAAPPVPRGRHFLGGINGGAEGSGAGISLVVDRRLALPAEGFRIALRVGGAATRGSGARLAMGEVRGRKQRARPLRVLPFKPQALTKLARGPEEARRGPSEAPTRRKLAPGFNGNSSQAGRYSGGFALGGPRRILPKWAPAFIGSLV